DYYCAIWHSAAYGLF
nr:immunoglobulin light chain junction region [Macaca mulatta]MOW02142.1 immunoglobulin light chain junction region [Macaca mulatta]MOW02192.1 immunoglobulin light chain junction region [Macaca mulatta]MOW02387.1 immunoglobulin light chain junction region [Macaca mulatta]MOW02400.1 immunoglobulin light chain junction region [Macaca mulatta]